jgi:hypothetical protein
VSVLKAKTVLAMADVQKGSYPGCSLIRSKLLGEIQGLLTDPRYDKLHAQKSNLEKLGRHLVLLQGSTQAAAAAPLIPSPYYERTSSTNSLPSSSSNSLPTPTISLQDAIPKEADVEFSHWLNSLPSDAAFGPAYLSSDFDSDLEANIAFWLNQESHPLPK